MTLSSKGQLGAVLHRRFCSTGRTAGFEARNVWEGKEGGVGKSVALCHLLAVARRLNGWMDGFALRDIVYYRIVL